MKNNNVGNSENKNSENNTTGDKARVCINSDRSKSIRTHIAGSVIEEYNNNPVENPYFVTKSQQDLKKQKAFANRLYGKRHRMKKKEMAEQPKKNKLTETEKKERRKKRDAERYKKRQQELKNNKTLNNFIIKPTVEKEEVSSVRMCTNSNSNSHSVGIPNGDPTDVPPVKNSNSDHTESSTTINVTPAVNPVVTNRIQARTPSRMNSGPRHLHSETDFTKKLYSKFNEGSTPHPPIEKERNYIDAQKQFLRKCNSMNLTYCSVCKERWFDTKIVNGKCKNCNKFSFTNDMDPFPGTCTYPFHLPKLTIIEEMLIAKAHVIMAVYRLKKSGTLVYKGNVLNVQQDNDALLKSILNSNDSLPRKISNLPVLYLRKNRSDDPMDFKDFIVKRRNVKLWLEFLVENNPLYRNQSINDDLLNELPEDGSILNSLTIQDDDEILTNEEQTSNEHDEECEQQMGPEQGGATGNTSLVGTDFLGPTNINNLEIEEERIENILRTHVEGTKNNPINWPTQSRRLNDYTQPFLQCMAFPTLFPYAKGDYFNRERNIEVSLTDANKHLLKYAIKNEKAENDELEPSYIYPFAEHDRWINWAQNISERHRIYNQRNVYLKKIQKTLI